MSRNRQGRRPPRQQPDAARQGRRPPAREPGATPVRPAAPAAPSAFTPPSDLVRAAFARYDGMLAKVRPLKGAHRRTLPQAVKRLSTLLTAERAERTGGYLRSAEAQSAYLYYFLPWNLYRLALLLPGLDLDLPDGATLVDVGSGPLTLPQALWLARPELRERELTVVCLDTQSGLMSQGADLLRELAGGNLPWRLDLRRGPVEQGLRGLQGKAHALFAANLLNEIGFRRGSPLESQVGGLVRRLLGLVIGPGQGRADAVRALFVEPGTRYGGKLLCLARESVLESGWTPAGPCVHAGDCPMLRRGVRTWCHFRTDVTGEPPWLAEIGEAAGLAKTHASLSYLALAHAEPSREAFRKVEARGVARILSDPFQAERPGTARYACSPRGLVIVFTKGVEIGNPLPPGSIVRFTWPGEASRDPKSGALEIDL